MTRKRDGDVYYVSVPQLAASLKCLFGLYGEAERYFGRAVESLN